MKTKFPQLMYEAKLYKMFAGGGKTSLLNRAAGIPTVHWFGQEGD